MEFNACGIYSSSKFPKPETLGHDDNKTLTPKKGIQVEGIWILMHVGFLHPLTSLQTCSIPRWAVRSHSLVCSKKYFLILGIGPIRDKEL